ncbi:3188_t:CDS:2, partial [Dentiscutata heterogama]
RDFILTVQMGIKIRMLMPEYHYKSEQFKTTENNPTNAISTIYALIFNTKTCYFGYQAFLHKKNRNILEQDNKCILEIYQDSKLQKQFVGTNPNEVWKLSGQLQKFRGTQLFRLKNYNIQTLICQMHIPVQFWTKSNNPNNDKELLANLHKIRYLTSIPSHIPNTSKTFWLYFICILADNEKYLDGKQHILSIIANDFSYAELQVKLEAAISNISGTRVANIMPNRDLKSKLDTISGISNFHEWTWPVDNENIGTNPQQKMTAEQMSMELKILAQESIIPLSDIPKVSSIRNWISGFSL